MRHSAERPVRRTLAAVIGLGAMIGGCSDIYYDRRETVLFGADNAVATNAAVQTIDPWPPGSANRSAPANGQIVAAAIERYRTGRVYIPIGNGTSSSYQQQQQMQQQQQQQAQPGQQAGAGAVSAPSGAQVKRAPRLRGAGPRHGGVAQPAGDGIPRCSTTRPRRLRTEPASRC
jgi:hypothetical protein